MIVIYIINFQNLSPGSPFYSQASLQDLSLHDNIINTLESSETFSGLISLETLDLSGNKLSMFKADVNIFKGLTSLKILDLSQNELSWIAPDIFSPLVSLTRLNLNGNKLRGKAILCQYIRKKHIILK